MAIAEYPKHLAVRMSRELSEQLKVAAAAENISVSDFVRRLIENRLAD
jgi:predicted HicB family RNase H-like nuclease